MLPLPDDVVAHGGMRRVFHPELGRQIHGQTAVRYMRFRQRVRIDHLELPLSGAVGRWVPKVPGHPAHLLISTPDGNGGWRLVKEVDLPRLPVIAGDGLSQETPVEEVERTIAEAAKGVCHRIDLGGLETECLRVECDREHPVWPNHGECNGGPYMVPFGILNPLSAHGDEVDGTAAVAERGELLTVAAFAPVAPSGMTVRDLPQMLLFQSDRLAIGFSLRRPLLMHLGWDAFGEDGAKRNRLSLRRVDTATVGGLSGPLLRGLDVDTAAHLWTGSVAVDGNQITYRVHPAQGGIAIEACFTVEADRIELALTQTCDAALPVLEAEAWRFAWNLRAGMTATAGLPVPAPGRNGDVQLPAFFATDGQGCLACRLLEGDPRTARLQTESYRCQHVRTDGFVLAPRPGDNGCLTLPAGTHRASFELAVTAFEPDAEAGDLPAGVRRHWSSVFACFRPELAGFSNHAASTNCHVNQWAPGELVTYTRRPTDGPDPVALAQFTVGRGLLDGGGYGYHRDLYLDSDPILTAMAGRLHQARADLAWLKRVEPGLQHAFDRVLGHVDESGLVVCRALSGNTGSHRWSCNAMDVVGFGHIDAYVNAWSYRAFRNAAVLFRSLGDTMRAQRAGHAAEALRAAYASALVNPDTGWVAGWRSRDGQLHDYAFPGVNGPAIAFGLLDDDTARQALAGLETLRKKAGLGSARLGLPCALLPIDPEDQMICAYAATGAQPTFELYTDGGASGSAGYYLRALGTYGFTEAADRLAEELDDGYAHDIFTGPIGEGQEFLSWEGLHSGYEGTLICRLDSLYAIAIQKGVLEPFAPEWWPE
jgi:hypothetical protein